MRLAEIIDDLLTGRTYTRTDKDGNQRECYLRRRYNRVVFEFSDRDKQEDASYADDWYSLLPYPDDLTADDWEPEVGA